MATVPGRWAGIGRGRSPGAAVRPRRGIIVDVQPQQPPDPDPEPDDPRDQGDEADEADEADPEDEGEPGDQGVDDGARGESSPPEAAEPDSSAGPPPDGRSRRADRIGSLVPDDIEAAPETWSEFPAADPDAYLRDEVPPHHGN